MELIQNGLKFPRVAAVAVLLLLAALPAQAIQAIPPPVSEAHIGLFRAGQWFLDLDDSRTWTAQDLNRTLGQPGDLPVTADWNQDGRPEIGVFRAGYWYIDANGNGSWNGSAAGDLTFKFGTTGDLPVAADWNHDGRIDAAVFRAGYWYVDTNNNGVWNGAGGGDLTFKFGTTGDLPVVGDWNGSNTLMVGVFRAGFWYLDMNGNRVWNTTGDLTFKFGQPGDLPVAADWNSDGITELALYRQGSWYVDFDNSHGWNANGDQLYKFGQPADLPLAVISLRRPVPDTGQTGDFTQTFGEDADYAVNPQFFSDNQDGTVTDNVTGLRWQQTNHGANLTWEEALNYCAVNTPGLPGEGWRLPSDFELLTIANYDTTVPAIDTAVFPGTQSWAYWAADEVATTPGSAWSVSFNEGGVYVFGKSAQNNAICVRGPARAPELTYAAGGTTVNDHVTGLTWQRYDDGTPKTWEAAIAYCEGLTLANSAGWRLPDFKELRSIVDVSRFSPAISPIFGGTDAAMYWSSTTFVDDNAAAWGVGFDFGSTDIAMKEAANLVRCVR